MPGLSNADFKEIKRMKRSGASPKTTVREMGLRGDRRAVADIETELTSLAPGSMQDYRSYLELMADEIERGGQFAETGEKVSRNEELSEFERDVGNWGDDSDLTGWR